LISRKREGKKGERESVRDKEYSRKKLPKNKKLIVTGRGKEVGRR